MERHRFFGDLDESAFLKQLELHIFAINTAIADIPRDRVRMHVCWGNNDGPHIYDIARRLFCLNSIARMSEPCRLSSRTRAISTNTMRCVSTRYLHT